jgi:hypothetical protein
LISERVTAAAVDRYDLCGAAKMMICFHQPAALRYFSENSAIPNVEKWIETTSCSRLNPERVGALAIPIVGMARKSRSVTPIVVILAQQ